MQLSARFLIDVASVNSYEVVPSVEWTVGDNQTLYFQLVDAALDRLEQGYNPPGRRYMPAATATVQLSMLNIDDAKKVVRFCSQPFPQDPSIWSVALLPTDPLRGTVSLKLLLTEPSRTLAANFTPGLVLRVKD